jgi:hypothetical protein
MAAGISTRTLVERPLASVIVTVALVSRALVVRLSLIGSLA